MHQQLDGHVEETTRVTRLEGHDLRVTARGTRLGRRSSRVTPLERRSLKEGNATRVTHKHFTATRLA